MKYYSWFDLSLVLIACFTCAHFLVLVFYSDISWKFIGLPLQALTIFLTTLIVVPSKRYLNYFVIVLLFILLHFEIVNKTHGSILLACCALFSRDVKLHFGAILILFMLNAKVPLILVGLSLVRLIQMSKLSVFFTILALAASLYTLVDHWFISGLDRVWAIQNRLQAFDAYINYLKDDRLRAFFPNSPAEIYERALDNGVLIGLIRYGILGFMLFLLLVITFLRKYFDWPGVVLLLIPFGSQAYLLHPVVFMGFLLLLMANKNLVPKNYA